MSEKQAFDPEILPDLLPIYYKRLFPHKPFGRWLTYDPCRSAIFKNREISFTLHDDIYVRYLSFESPLDLEKEICSKVPFKIDIGAVYNDDPRKHRNSSMLKPVQREFVIDIDLTDYDDVRRCCKGAEVCEKCWKLMTIACRILDTALREDFGFEHILWVFSGRRGIHAWVCDEIARNLNTKGREAIAEYLQIITCTTTANKIFSTTNIGDKIHHSVKRALKIIEPMFEEIFIKDQNLFATPNGLQILLQMVDDENIRRDLEIHLNKFENNSKIIWEQFVKYFYSLRTQSTINRRVKNIIEEVQLALAYPRLDINVSKGFNHLLKSPFCIHPATGKVCIPINPNAVGKFDPTNVPTINILLDEINAFDKSKLEDEIDTPENRNRIKDYKKTGMFKSVLVFEEFLRKLENSFKVKAIDISDAKMEF